MRSATKRSDPPVRDRRQALVDDPGIDDRAFSARYTELVDDWVNELLGDGDGVAAIAVGSYGRGELSPHSDLDIVLVHSRPRDVSMIADRLWYPIWDAGFRLDHSVRTVREALGIADRDVKALLGLVDARFVAGDRRLANELHRRTRELAHRRGRYWIPALREDTEHRHRRAGHVAFLLEPELKDGRGGLRDLTVERILRAVVPGVVTEPSLLVSVSTVLSVRVALQRVSGRAVDQMLLDYQDAVAARLGYRDAEGLMTSIATAAREIAWQLDETWRLADSWLSPGRGLRTSTRPRPLAPGIELRGDEIDLAPGAPVTTEPAVMVDAARISAELGLSMARRALRRMAAETPPATMWSQHLRDAFLALLGAGDATVATFETLDQYRLVERLLPEWSAVRGKVQRNAFHRYTVDRHLVETVARAGALTRDVARPDLLLVGALLHDIGKGCPGDHTDAGVVVAERIATRMGFGARDVATIAALVRHHLLLPEIATSRDLRDPRTAESVAAAIGTVDLLELLHALTEADSRATGESAWSRWKAELVGELVWRVRRVFEGGHEAAAPPSLALAEDDAPLVARAGDAEVHVEVAGETVTVVARDRPGLFCDVVGVLAFLGLSVRGARARCRDELAIDEFEVESSAGRALEPEVFDAELRRAVTGELQLDAELERRAREYQRLKRPAAARVAAPRVLVDPDPPGDATLVQIRAADRVGLLYAVSRVLADHGLDIRHARISTLGHEVVDTFSVVETRGGARLTDGVHMATLERALLAALRPPTGSGSADSDRSDSGQMFDHRA